MKEREKRKKRDTKNEGKIKGKREKVERRNKNKKK